MDFAVWIFSGDIRSVFSKGEIQRAVKTLEACIWGFMTIDCQHAIMGYRKGELHEIFSAWRYSDRR